MFKAEKKLPNGEKRSLYGSAASLVEGAAFEDVAARNPDVMIEAILQEQNAEQMLITEQVLI